MTKNNLEITQSASSVKKHEGICGIIAPISVTKYSSNSL